MNNLGLALGAANVGLLPLALSDLGNRYGYLHGLESSSAVREQTRKQADQHKEVMGALKDLGKDKIAVTVVAAEVLPACNKAVEKLAGPAADYDAAYKRWHKRYSRVSAWKRKRKERKETAQREAEIVALSEEYVEKHSTWCRRVTLDEARDEVEKKLIRNDMFSYGRIYGGLHEFEMLKYHSSHPKKPGGYDDLPAIRELQQAASLSPNAVLTVPVSVVVKLQRWAA